MQNLGDNDDVEEGNSQQYLATLGAYPFLRKNRTALQSLLNLYVTDPQS